MLSVRLPIALERGLVSLPESGTIGVFGVRASDRLDVLPKERLQVIARHYPDHKHFGDLGFDVATEPSANYALSIVVLPRAKDEARLLIAQAAARTNGVVAVDGQKTDGIDGLLKEMRTRGDVGEVLSKAHGKFAVANGLDCDDWLSPDNKLVEGRFKTAPGVFSADGVDPGSALLASVLPSSLKGRVVDLGAGWGYLADTILSRDGVVSLDLVEADHAALEMAGANISDSRASFHWADARDYHPESPFDHVVTNPPFHTGRKADASLGQAFIQQAAAILKPKGSLWLVANRHLPYEAVLKDAFAQTRVLDETSSYKLFQAKSPRCRRKG